MENGFPIRKVIKIVDVKRDAFKAWVHRGYIKPSIYQAQGPGEQSLYSRGDLYTIKLFDHLLSAGMPRQMVSLMIKGFENEKHEEIAWVAFIKRPVGKEFMHRKSGSYITIDGRTVSDKALAPGVRFLKDSDVKKTFQTLFLTYDDTDVPKKFNIEDVKIEIIHIVEFRNLKVSVDTAIESL